MRVRVARHIDNLAAVVAFYRDVVGLPEVGRFSDHAGYDGVILEVPGAQTHLEFTSGGGQVAARAPTIGIIRSFGAHTWRGWLPLPR